jgi:hypothetical protein
MEIFRLPASVAEVGRLTVTGLDRRKKYGKEEK